MQKFTILLLMLCITISCNKHREKKYKDKPNLKKKYKRYKKKKTKKNGPKEIPPHKKQIKPAKGIISFCSRRGGDWGIYLIYLDGLNIQRVRSGYSPSWANKKRIVFTQFYLDTNRFEVCATTIYSLEQKEVKIIASNIYNLKIDRLTSAKEKDSSSPAFSPDGKYVAYQSGYTNKPKICIMKADGSEKRIVTKGDYIEKLPCWSPDGKKIAFTSFRKRKQGIYVMNIDGSQVKRLSSEKTSCSYPAWSPDGKYIAYVATKRHNGVWKGNLRIMNPKNGNWWTLVKNKKSLESPAWSADGNWLSFNCTDKTQDIYIVNFNGKGLKNLTNDKAYDHGASWIP